MEVSLNPPLLAPAPISTQAPVNLQGSFILNAYDNCTCTCTTPKNGPATCNNPPVASCYSTAHAVFTQQTVSQTANSGQTSTSYGNDPTGAASVQNVNPWPSNLNIDNLINQYKSGATPPPFTCAGPRDNNAIPPVYPSCGTQSNQQFGTYPSAYLPT